MQPNLHRNILLASMLMIAVGFGYWLASDRGEDTPALMSGSAIAQSEQAAAGNAQTQSPAPADDTQLGKLRFNDDELRTMTLFEQASPAVVNINTLEKQLDLYSRRVREKAAGSGSGFMWDDQGHVVTNYHVIRGASGAQVILDDKSVHRADLVGVSPDHDLAVLRIKLNQDQATPLPLGDSETLSVGQTVFAIGNPFGLDHTLTKGIISAVGREITSVSGQRIVDVVQTDAAINPGNSGGPLLDSSGRVIGVNTAIFSPSGASNGIGFAVPIGTVRRVVPQLIEHGEYRRPDLGIRADERISRRLLSQVGLRGVLVLGVEAGSGAEEAGLVPTKRTAEGAILLGDVITAINGTKVESVSDLRLVLDELESGDEVVCTVVRAREKREVTLVLR